MLSGTDFSGVVEAAGRGEHEALTLLFRAYQPALLRYLRSQAPAVADDLASEVWIGAARRLPHFVGDETAFRGWLFTIARRRVIEHRRRAERDRSEPLSSDLLDTIIDLGTASDPAVAVVDRASAQDAVDMLVAELTPDQAEVVLLRVVSGLSVAEVARLTGRPSGAVRVLCHRALRRLATRLGEGARTG
jgi:RNA polymerase sigma-70 factor, ECF subfamily